MKKVLGLDLGSSSIGWAFIEESDKKSTIKKLGVRIIPYSGDEKDQFTKGQAISVNKDRTLKRTARKTLNRYKLRRKALYTFLEKNGMNPATIEMLNIPALSLYGIRAKAAVEKVSLKDIGRILLHMNQKRGYKSSRSGNNEEDNGKKLSDYLTEMKDRKDVLEKEQLTIGQFFFGKLQTDRHFRVKQQVFPRECYINEFNQIWDTQRIYYPDLFTEENRKIVRDQIIYYQRRLKSQKGLVSECRYELHHKVAPKSSPLFQVEKIWESIHTISISNKRKENYPISAAQKQQIFHHLDSHEKMTQTDLFKILGLKRTDGWYANEQIRKSGLQGNMTKSAILRKMKESDLADYEIVRFNLNITQYDRTDKENGEIISLPIIAPDFEKEPLYQLWHLLYSIDDPENLKKLLMSRFKLTYPQASAFSLLDFKKPGFGNKSSRAIRKLLPSLMNGYNYSDACDQTGYNHSDSLTNTENEQRELLPALPLYPRNALRQPVVEKILNQLVNIINSIIRDEHLGRPDEIRIELARELKQSKDERNRTYSNIIDAEKKHKEIKERLSQEFPGLAVTRKVIEKYKLYVQQGGLCIYSGEKMELTRVLRGEGIDIDHIIPQSRLFDDSFQNKVLAFRKENEAKKDLTGYDYMKSKAEEAFKAYTERVGQLYEDGQISRSKQTKLLMEASEIPDDFINRQMNETRYISREATRLLKSVCRNVFSSSGMVTDYLRNQWGYNDVLKQLNWDKYEAAGKIVDGKIEGWSKRDDHRHHAIDALIVACTKQSFIQRLNNLNSSKTREEMLADIAGKTHPGWQAKKSLVDQHVQLLQPFSTKEVKEAVANILVSLKAGKKVATRGYNKADGKRPLTPRGQLHKEQVYGKIQRYSKKVVLNGRFTDSSRIADPVHKKLIEERLSRFGGDPKKAFKTLDKDPIWTDEQKTSPLTEVTLWEEHFVYKYTLNQQFKEKDIDYIIDKKIQSLVRARFAERAGQKDHPLKNLEQDPIWLDKKNGITVKSVRCFTGLNDLTALHVTENGFTKPKLNATGTTKNVDFVSTRNNHHVAIYKDTGGRFYEKVVSLWETIERKKSGIPVIVTNAKTCWDDILNRGIDNQDILQNLPGPEDTFIISLQQNEMFVFNMNEESLRSAITSMNYALISPNLYRVQKITNSDYNFRHHLETRLEQKEETALFSKLEKFIRFKSIGSFLGKVPIKVKSGPLGEIKIV